MKKIIVLVIDGLGGVSHPNFSNFTELEYAKHPNMDYLVTQSDVGLTISVDYGITPGSGPGHLAIFGYEPLKYQIGRGVLEALGVGFDLQKNDIAIRANFATKDKDGYIIDRRAGRIPTEKNRELVNKLSENIKEIDGVEIIFKSGKEHRFVIVLRGEGLGDKVNDTDPQKIGLKPLEPQGKDENSQKTALILKKLLEKINEILKDEDKANTVLLRGVSKLPDWPNFEEKHNLKACGLAYYPMYKGLAKLVGMDVPENLKSFEECIKFLKENFDKYDYFYLHFKETDKAGEDGDFLKKVEQIEKVDKFIPQILSLNPDVFVITSDHSTPALLKGHSWHPNPTLIYSKYSNKNNHIKRFTEKECLKGNLGIFYAYKLMNLIKAHALILKKFGA